jgi:hypothetical protein
VVAILLIHQKNPTSTTPKKVCDAGLCFWVQQIHETVAYFVDLWLDADSITFMQLLVSPSTFLRSPRGLALDRFGH